MQLAFGFCVVHLDYFDDEGFEGYGSSEGSGYCDGSDGGNLHLQVSGPTCYFAVESFPLALVDTGIWFVGIVVLVGKLFVLELVFVVEVDLVFVALVFVVFLEEFALEFELEWHPWFVN